MARSLTVAADVDIDMGGNVLTNLADGVAASDAATVGQLGGGGVHTREIVVSNPAVSIGNGSFAKLTWDDVQFGDTLLDLTDPENPAVLTTGIYAVTCYVTSTAALTAGGTYIAELDITTTDTSLTVQGTAAAGVLPSTVTVGVTWYLQATTVLSVTVVNEDGASSRDFLLSAYVQRIA